MIRTKGRVRLCTALVVLNLALIWGNSLLPGADSEGMSGGVVELLMELPILSGISADIIHTAIRKLVHFAEFACLGALLTWRCGMAERDYPPVTGVLWSMGAALIDETIQMFVPERGPGLVDVWIDVSGAAAGMLMLLCGHHLMKRIKNNQR